MQSEGFDDDAGFEETIKKLEADLKKARRKDEDVGDEVVSIPNSKYGVILFHRAIGGAGVSFGRYS